MAYAEPDYRVYGAATTPNDRYYNSLWGMSKIEAPLAWDSFTGSSNVVVAVLDTGIDYTHPDLAANMWVDPNPADGEHMYGKSCVSYTTDPKDDHSHGTHVAGIIGAVGNNSIGVTGINWNVKLAAIKVFSDDGEGWISDWVAGIYYAIQKEFPIINASFATKDSYDSAALRNAIYSYDGLFIAGSGNGINNDGSSSDNDKIKQYPANYGCEGLENVISVGATNSSDYNVFNYGKNSVHLGAPGYNVYSTLPNNSYDFKDGTSMAAPHVAGAAALLMGYRPDLTPLEVKAMILSTVDRPAQLQNRYISGGRLNINNMLKAAIGDKNIIVSTPDLDYNGTNNLMTFNTVQLSAEGAFPSRVFVVINKYNDSNPNVPASTISGFVNINTSGIGTYSSIPSSLHFNAANSFLEILVYEGSAKEVQITRQLVRPAVFDLSGW